MIGSLIDKLDDQPSEGSLKMVKGSSLFASNGIIYIKHYGTIIFAHDSKSKRCEIDLKCSMTSDRMIRRALNHFGIPEASCINIHDGSDWNYSSGLMG